MALHCHYYVLSLGIGTSLLFEGFRSQLVEIRNEGFPVVRAPGPDDAAVLPDLARTIDRNLAHYHESDPLGIVLVGSRPLLSAFEAVTAHTRSIVARIEGDHADTSHRDLGQIVWPVVKIAMSRQIPLALQSLSRAAAAGRAVTGLEAVAERIQAGSRGTLLVEDDFHLRGGFDRSGRLPAVTSQVDVRDALDDAVDAVVEQSLAIGGRVIFTPNGSLATWDRIAFLSPRAGAK